MAVKYTIPYRQDDNILWRADIDIPAYVGDPIELTGIGRVFCQPEWATGGEDPYEPIVGSRVTIQFYDRAGEVDIQELQLLQDMEGRLHVYRDNELEWTGYITPDGIQRMIAPNPYPITINATDGLSLLKDVPFDGPSFRPLQAGASNRSPLAYVRDILFNFHLNIPLPIRWVMDVECNEYPGEDAFAGTIDWGARSEVFYDSQTGDSKLSCYWILEGMLRSFQCRIFQQGGLWQIERINDTVSGIKNWKQIGTEYGPGDPPTVTSGTDDDNIDIGTGGYPFINENQVATVSPALTDVVAVYEHIQAENVLPNGGFDLWGTGGLLYWGFIGSPPSTAIFSHDSLTGRPGFAADLWYISDGTNDAVAEFALSGGLPIDANILFKRLTLGFTFLPLNGFPYTDELNNQNIIWDDNPLTIQVSYVIPAVGGDQIYYLNEYGYWQYEPDEGYLYQVSYVLDIEPPVDVHTITYAGYPKTGDIIRIHVTFPGTILPEDIYEHVIDGSEEGDLEAALTSIASQIPLATVTMADPFNGYIKFDTNVDWDAVVLPSVSSGYYTILAGNKIPISVESMRIGDIASVVFQGKAGNNEIIIPDPGTLDGSQGPDVGKLYVKVYVKEGQRLVLDDLYVRVEENNDIYQSINQGSTIRSNRQQVELNISSGFTGFILSSYMTSYDKSNLEFIFSDSKYTGSLTGMTANAMMRFRYLPSEVFSGDILTNGSKWKFNHIYNFNGKKYLPLSSKINTETGVVSIVAIECRDGDPILTENHYGSNDKILSN